MRSPFMAYPRFIDEHFVMPTKKVKLGNSGEALAVTYLKKLGIRIIETNYRSRFGEIDIIGLDGDSVCFVEVKTRRSLTFGEGYESVFGSKEQRIMKTAMLYLADKRWADREFRFDVISIFLSDLSPKIEYLKGAFEGF